jgi:hypothetical protein
MATLFMLIPHRSSYHQCVLEHFPQSFSAEPCQKPKILAARRYIFSVNALALALAFMSIASCAAGEFVRVYPAPAGEPLSTNFTVTIGSNNVPVYIAKVATADSLKRQKVSIRDDNSFADTTAFASFDLHGSVQVSVSCPEPVNSAKILPVASGIAPIVSSNRVVFTVSKPCQLELEVNDDWVHSLQLFVDPVETAAPRPDDPNVIYFGPGRHEVEDMVVTSGKTVYVAGGAVIYGKVNPEVHGRGKGKITAITELGGGAIFSLVGNNIKLCGRGIIDGSLCPGHTRNILSVCGTNISLEGVVVRDASTWTMPIQCSDQVVVKNVKVFGYRGNSDGIDICNSRHVEVTGCFLRTWDDLVVVKTPIQGGGESRDITVKGCVLWNELAQALTIGAELRENVENVHFSDCDVIHDKGRAWLLRIFHTDSADIHNITFDNIRAEESRRLISLSIVKTGWSKDNERGHIENITFRNIQVAGTNLTVDLKGFDSGHEIRGVRFRNVVLNGQPLKPGGVNQNEFVQGVSVSP